MQDNNSNQLSIAEFYKGKNVFVTGGTGFIGKMIVEKLLRSCPDVDTIYCLARSKRNKTAEDRVKEMTSSPLFDKIRESNPEVLQKISFIEGDVSKSALGLSEADQELFCDKINIVIHSAATISFSEPIKIAVATNLQSVNELIKLARRCKSFDALVHISTAYTNWFHLNVKEEFYQPKYDPNEVIKMCQTLSDEEISKKISIHPHVNTYTFSKSLAEYLIATEGKDLPIAVVRPSITISSHKEPIPGWADSYAALSRPAIYASRGILKSIHMLSDNVCQVITADIVVNMTIAAAWKKGTEKLQNRSPIVFNCTTGTHNPITWREIFDYIEINARKYPMTYFGDLVLRLSGEKPRYFKMLYYSHKSYEDSKFVTCTVVKFDVDKVDQMAKLMSQKDLKEFDFDVRSINWKKCIEDYYFGMQKYLKNEDPKNIPALRMKVARMKYTNYLIMGSTVAASLYLLNKTKHLFCKEKLKKNEQN